MSPRPSGCGFTAIETLADDWYVLRKYRFDYRRADGSWQELTREAYDRGNGAAILLYDRARRSVFLTRQFRLPAFVNGHADGMLLEAPAGLLDAEAPADAIRREVEEETGFRLRRVEEVLAAYMSPGSVTERLHFFVAEVALADRIARRRRGCQRGRGHRGGRAAVRGGAGGDCAGPDRRRQDDHAALPRQGGGPDRRLSPWTGTMSGCSWRWPTPAGSAVAPRHWA